MAHKHQVYDTDLHFTIDKITRRISSTSGKVILMQNDHNSERFTFQLDRFVEGHDMMLCNRVEVHYINIDSANKRNKTEDVYEVLDLQLSPDDENVVILSWLISQNATMYAGTLSFLVRFACIADDEEKTIDYQWFTDIYTLISIAKGIYNSDVLTDEGDPDILAQWKQEIMDLAQPYVDSSANSAAAAAMSEANARNSELNAATSEANAKESEQYAAASETNAKISETNAAKSETNAATSEANAKASEEYAAEYADKADNLNAETLETLQRVSESVEEYTARIGNTSFTVNLETGELEYESPDYIFYVNEETGNLEWETLHEHSDSADNIIHTVRNEKSDAVVLEAAGTYFVVEDSSDDPLRGLKLFGKTEQTKTTGKNLFDVNVSVSMTEQATYTRDGDSIIVKSSPESESIGYGRIAMEVVNIDSTKTYTLSFDTDSAAGIMVGWFGCAKMIHDSGKTHYSVIFSDITTSTFSLGCTEADTSIRFSNIQIEEGSTETDYEPYTGCVPSPNPSYPQELVNLENPTVYIAGGNLLNASTVTDGYRVSATTGSVNIYGDGVSVSDYIVVSGAKKITISGNVTTVTTNNALAFFDRDKKYVSGITSPEGVHPLPNVTYDVPDNAYYVRVNMSTTDVNALVVNIGDSALVHTPYCTLQEYVPTLSLPGIPVTSGGNYTDANGQQWISDEIDFERGVYVRRVKQIDLTTITDWNSWGVSYIKEGYTGFYRYDDDLGNDVMDALCTIAPFKGDLWGGAGLGAYSNIDGKQYIAVSVSNDYLTDTSTKELAIESFISLLQETNAKMLATAKPLERSLSKEELEAFKSLHTNYPTTTVFNDSDVYMELKYNADTKNYIAAEHVKMEAAFNAKIAEVMALISAQT